MDNQIIPFNKNWNKKLDCNSFSTIRLENNSKYKVGNEYVIILSIGSKVPPKNLGPAKLISISSFLLENLNDSMSYLDTNLPKEDCIQMIKTMYSKSNIDFSRKKLSFMVLQYLNQK
jgi:hypothetical protein